jgi:hypothetical protein
MRRKARSSASSTFDSRDRGEGFEGLLAEGEAVLGCWEPNDRAGAAGTGFRAGPFGDGILPAEFCRKEPRSLVCMPSVLGRDDDDWLVALLLVLGRPGWIGWCCDAPTLRPELVESIEEDESLVVT